jgi:two-component system, cell cycle sensor histidine kinase and response regulator CckA
MSGSIRTQLVGGFLLLAGIVVAGAVLYTVTEATNGDKARAVAERSGRFDLLVTDVIMPGITGPERACRLVAKQPDLRVLFISGYPARAIEQHGVLGPDVNFLQKPFQPAAFVLRVQQLIESGT